MTTINILAHYKVSGYYVFSNILRKMCRDTQGVGTQNKLCPQGMCTLQQSMCLRIGAHNFNSQCTQKNKS